MGWFLSDHVETWIARFFIFLAVVNISPWVLAILYDIVLYITRSIWYYVPVYGGRARGQQRPRAPTLRDRARRMSIAEIITGSSSSPSRNGEQEKNVPEMRRRHMHERTLSGQSTTIEEEDVEGEEDER